MNKSVTDAKRTSFVKIRRVSYCFQELKGLAAKKAECIFMVKI